MKRIYYLYKKEFLQLKRDAHSVIFFTLMPVVLLMLFGFALSTDIKHISTAVFDDDNNYLSRELAAVLVNSEYFDITHKAFCENDIQELLDKGKVKVGLIIPQDFSANCLAGKQAEVQILIDGSDPNVANTALNVGNACVNYLSKKYSNPITAQIIKAQPRIWYNPALRSANFMVPGLIGLILQMLIPLMTVVGIVKERETGTIEQLITTPIKPWELILGKLLPYLTIAIGVVFVVTIAGISVFHIPLKGSIFLLALFIFLFMMVCLTMGLLFSAVSKNQLQAFQKVIFTGIPSILLSGLIFPREAMPKLIYYISNLLPLTYFINLVRGVFLKGVGFTYLWNSFAALLGFEAIYLIGSIKKFKKQIA